MFTLVLKCYFNSKAFFFVTALRVRRMSTSMHHNHSLLVLTKCLNLLLRISREVQLCKQYLTYSSMCVMPQPITFSSAFFIIRICLILEPLSLITVTSGVESQICGTPVSVMADSSQLLLTPQLHQSSKHSSTVFPGSRPQCHHVRLDNKYYWKNTRKSDDPVGTSDILLHPSICCQVFIWLIDAKLCYIPGGLIF